MADSLSEPERRQVLAQLDELRRETQAIASWLTQADADRPLRSHPRAG
jgi:hypothetical protein